MEVVLDVILSKMLDQWAVTWKVSKTEVKGLCQEELLLLLHTLHLLIQVQTVLFQRELISILLVLRLKGDDLRFSYTVLKKAALGLG